MSVRVDLVDGGIAVVTMDHPPVNGFALALRRGLVAAFERVRDDDGIRAVVLTGAGRMFSAGGDLRELGTPDASAEPGLAAHVHPAMERCGKPIVAALHGAALGGGLETALVCHERVAAEDTKFALPETTLGMIPPSGTQRLLRLVAVDAAVAMAVRAEPYTAATAPIGLVDELVRERGQVVDAAITRARRILAAGIPLPLARDRPLSPGLAAALRAARRALDAGGATDAQRACFDALQAAADAPDFDTGLARSRAIYAALVDSDGARAARAAFLASRGEPRA